MRFTHRFASGTGAKLGGVGFPRERALLFARRASYRRTFCSECGGPIGANVRHFVNDGTTRLHLGCGQDARAPPRVRSVRNRAA